jgi:very-short-patch-repair endonuclease
MAKQTTIDQYPIYFGASPELLRIASVLRFSMTKAERLLWEKLRNRQLMGFKFRRQHPLNEIIVDFYCHEAKISIEVDGGVHYTQYQQERDKERTLILNRFGIKEFRFSNWQVENKIDFVLGKINDHLLRFPNPSPYWGRGGSSPHP